MAVEGTGPSTSSSLLLRVRAHDPEAWRRLARLYGPLVYAWCRRAGLQPADAADVGQEVFLAVVKGIAAFRRDRPGDSFRGWLFTITRHKVNDHWRRQARRLDKAAGGSAGHEPLAQEPAGEPSSLPVAAGPGEWGELLSRALNLVRPEFTEKTWQAFWRVAAEGQTPADVAAELGMSPNAVRIAQCRVLRRLREEFGDLID